MKNIKPPWEFTCKICGANQLTVTRVWNILAGPDSEKWQEWGPLEADHSWCFKFKEKIENEQDNEASRVGYRKAFREYINDDSNARLKDNEIHTPHSNPGNDMYFVNCSGCDREIEFGWSQPDRGGRIFPVECSDFMPHKLWPEPRFVRSWHEQHLLKEKSFDKE